MTHVFKHPKFYRIPRDKSDQAISDEASTEATSVRPGPGHKPQAPSKVGSKASSLKQQATSVKRQATSVKHQAVRDD